MAYATQAKLQRSVAADRESAPRHARAHPAAGDVRLTIHQDLAAIEHDWLAFEQHADCTVFQTFEWLSAWQRNVGERNGVTPLIVAGRDDAGRLLFLFPFAIEPGRLARRLRWLGSDLCDYNAPLLAADYSERGYPAGFLSVWRDIVQRLQSHPKWSYDLIDLEKMPETVGGQANPFLRLGASVHPRGAYHTHLAGDWETYYAAKRSTSTRRRDRTKRNRLGDLGAVAFATPDSAADITDTLDTLMVQKARSLAEMGAANIFARPGYPEFFRDLATSPRTRELVHVSRLDVGSTAAAINLGVVFRGCYYHILASYADGEIARFGPGVAHLHDLLRYAIGRNCRTFDFTIGDERYKRDWCDAELTLYDHVVIAGVRGAVAAAPIVALRRLKGLIRNNPKLLDWAKRARARAGSLTALLRR
jgi:CelD/BcsL family acetyltransferase involved in cellulose biosynthesis